MSKVVQIAEGVVNAQLLQPTQELKSWFTEWLSYENDGESAFSSNVHSGHGTLFDWKTARFPAGFVRLVETRLRKRGYRVIVRRREAPAALGPEKPTVDSFGEDPRYAYQRETVDRLLTMRRMIAQVATGGGKSRIARIAYKRIGRTTLFLTTRKSLAYQMAESINRDLNEKCGFLGDNRWDFIEGGFNVAIVDTLSSRLVKRDLGDEALTVVELLDKTVDRNYKAQAKAARLPVTEKQLKKATDDERKECDKLYALVKRDMDQIWTDARIEKEARARLRKHNDRRNACIKVLERCELAIVEEAHEVSAQGFYDVMAACKNAHYRLALTATPFMRDGGEANMRLMASTGPIGIKISEKRLIDLGILARPYFRFVPSESVKMVARGTGWQKAYQYGVMENLQRNKAILKEIIRGREYGLTTMVLIQRKDHGKWICDALGKLGMKARFISGDDDQTVRQSALDALGSGELDALIGSTILDVGVDVPAVGQVIIAGGGKAEVAARQRIGRGLRAKKKGPNVCLVVDFWDEFNKHLLGHSRQRLEVVKSTPGFAEGLLDAANPFPYEELGFTRTNWRAVA